MQVECRESADKAQAKCRQSAGKRVQVKMGAALGCLGARMDNVLWVGLGQVGGQGRAGQGKVGELG